MSRNGAGVYILPTGQPVVTGTAISSTTFNTLTTDLANALTTSIASDGQTAMSANLPMGGNKLTGLGAATVAGDAVRFQQAAMAGPLASSGITGAAASGVNTDITSLGNNTSTAYTTGGILTAYTLTPTPAITAYAAGQSFGVTFAVASGAAPTITISGIATPPNLVKQIADGTYGNIAAGDIPINHKGQVTLLSPTQALVGLPVAKSGANSDITSLTALTSVNVGQLAGLRNRIINGKFSINQRAVSGTVTLTSGSYGHDRFKAGASGCTYTFASSQNGNILTISAGTLQQVIEGANLEGGTFVLSWFGTATGRIDSGAYSASGVTGTATAGTNQTVEFGTGTLGRVQYELGTIATTFEQRPIGMENSLCHRYFMFEGFAQIAPVSSGISLNYMHKVNMRTTPTSVFTTNNSTPSIPAQSVSNALISASGGSTASPSNITISFSAEL